MKAILKRIVDLIRSPRFEWEKIRQEDQSAWNVQLHFYYPLLVLVAVATIFGYLINVQTFAFDQILKQTFVMLTSRFAGFFLSVVFLNEIIASSLFNMERQYNACVRIIAYSSCIMFSTDSIIALLPDFFILRIVNFYVIYMIWEGAGVLFDGMEENKKGVFTAVCFILLYGLPYLIELLMYRMMK